MYICILDAEIQHTAPNERCEASGSNQETTSLFEEGKYVYIIYLSQILFRRLSVRQ